VVAERDTTSLTTWMDNIFGFHLLGPDNKIYVSNFYTSAYLHVINQPDVQGQGCDVVQQAVILPVTNTMVLPNAVNYSLGPVTGSPCDTLLGVTTINAWVQHLIISPNPAASQLTVQYTPVNTQSKATLINSTGQQVEEIILPPNSSSKTINIEYLPPGIYLLRLQTDTYSGEKKFVKY
jgi:hypothetical protein